MKPRVDVTRSPRTGVSVALQKGLVFNVWFYCLVFPGLANDNRKIVLIWTVMILINIMDETGQNLHLVCQVDQKVKQKSINP